MQLCATNRDSGKYRADCIQVGIGETHSSFKTDRQWLLVGQNRLAAFSFETYIGMEFSLVPEVETVFVTPDSDAGKAYNVITVVNDRNSDVRAKVYAREQAIMDEARGIEFSFRVLSRMNRNLSELINTAGKIAFQRSR